MGCDIVIREILKQYYTLDDPPPTHFYCENCQDLSIIRPGQIGTLWIYGEECPKCGGIRKTVRLEKGAV